MRLCAEVVVAGGLVALDDYFNQRYPGRLRGRAVVRATASGRPDAGRRRVQQSAFQRAPSPISTNASPVTSITSRLTSRPCGDDPSRLFESPIVPCVDLDRLDAATTGSSTESRLLMRATIEPRMAALSATPRPGAHDSGAGRESHHRRFRMGYRLVVSPVLIGRTVGQVGQPAKPLQPVLSPGPNNRSIWASSRLERGPHTLELDMVWEGIAWFQDKGQSHEHRHIDGAIAMNETAEHACVWWTAPATPAMERWLEAALELAANFPPGQDVHRAAAAGTCRRPAG